jgi:hypothetical protein
MPERPVHPDPVDEPQLPAALVEALGGLHPRGPAVPGGVNWAILTEARAGYARRRRFWVAARAVGAMAAAAAAIVLAVVAVRERRHAVPAPVAATRGVGQSGQSGDLDGNGRVDVLDAFLLARRVRDGVATPGDDANGDGVVDQRDVDRVAGLAVSIEAGEAKGGLR